MGGSFEAEKGFIGNHRIRAKFINLDGSKCFIEVGTTRENNKMRCDHALINYCDEWASLKERDVREKRLSIERNGWDLDYTFDNLLKLVNENFKCDFDELVVEEYTLRTDDIASLSPGLSKVVA